MNKNTLPKYIKSYETKIGKLTIGSNDNSITHIFFYMYARSQYNK